MGHRPAQAGTEVGLPYPASVEAPRQAHQLAERCQSLLGPRRTLRPRYQLNSTLRMQSSGPRRIEPICDAHQSPRSQEELRYPRPHCRAVAHLGGDFAQRGERRTRGRGQRSDSSECGPTPQCAGYCLARGTQRARRGGELASSRRRISQSDQEGGSAQYASRVGPCRQGHQHQRVLDLWPVEEIAELADRHPQAGEDRGDLAYLLMGAAEHRLVSVRVAKHTLLLDGRPHAHALVRRTGEGLSAPDGWVGAARAHRLQLQRSHRLV